MLVINLVALGLALVVLAVLRLLGLSGSPIQAHMLPFVITGFQIFRWTIVMISASFDRKLTNSQRGLKSVSIGIFSDKPFFTSIPWSHLQLWLSLLLVMGISTSIGQAVYLWEPIPASRVIYNFALGIIYFSICDVMQNIAYIYISLRAVH